MRFQLFATPGIGITIPSSAGHTAHCCVNAVTAPVTLPFDPSSGTHNYTIVWGTSSVLFVIDGEVVHTVPKTAPQDVRGVEINPDTNWLAIYSCDRFLFPTFVLVFFFSFLFLFHTYRV